MQFQTKDPKAIRNAFRGRNLKRIGNSSKPNTDYVSAPNTNKKTEHPYQYDKDFLSTDRKVNKTVNLINYWLHGLRMRIIQQQNYL